MRLNSTLLALLLLALASTGCSIQYGGTRKAYNIESPPAVGASDETQQDVLKSLGRANKLLFYYFDFMAPVPHRVTFSMGKQTDFVDRHYLPVVLGQLAAASCVAHQVWPQERPEAIFNAALNERTISYIIKNRARLHPGWVVAGVRRFHELNHAVRSIPCEKLGDMTVAESNELIKSQFDQMEIVGAWRYRDDTAWATRSKEADQVLQFANEWESVWDAASGPDNDVARIIRELRYNPVFVGQIPYFYK